ncbi:MAG: hypothetical protein H0Z24_06815 [Thermosipho sp. (in: Bacteria)]|nr:hypothetical protein [Thermosipho sp. (in: thermotogales)]
MEIYILAGIIAFQFIYIIYKDYTYSKEKKDLLNRLMAKDLTEYIKVENPTVEKPTNPLKKRLEREFAKQGFIE